jgi:hypothetical protein
MARFTIVTTQFWVTIATSCRTLTRSMNRLYVLGHERESSHSFKCIISIKGVLITFWWGGYVKCSIPQKDDGLRLNICECYSWEITLYIGLNASFHNVWLKGIWKDAEEINSTKAYMISSRLSVTFSQGVALVCLCVRVYTIYILHQYNLRYQPG